MLPQAAAAPKAAGTQAPPPAKLELPKAKLEAAAVNDKQWINPAPAVAAVLLGWLCVLYLFVCASVSAALASRRQCYLSFFFQL